MKEQKNNNPAFRSPAFRVYYKRVMRYVRRHPDDVYIDHLIARELWGKVTSQTGPDPEEYAVRDALKSMGKPSGWGSYYHAKFIRSIERVTGFLVWEPFFDGIAPALLILVVTLAVFRMWPQTEYVAYGLFALGAAAAAWICHRKFLRVWSLAVSVFVPSLLLIFYPLRTAAAEAKAESIPFWNALFRYSHHVNLVIVGLLFASFVLTTVFLHARDYTLGGGRSFGMTVTVLIAAVLAAGLIRSGIQLKRNYDVEAASLYADMQRTLTEWENGGAAEPALAEAVRGNEMLARYQDIYVPPAKQTRGSYEECLQLLELYEQAPENAVLKYHPSFRTDSDRPFDSARFAEMIAGLRADLRDAMNASEGKTPGFRSLVQLEKRTYRLKNDFLKELDALYVKWFYADKKE